MFSNSSMFIKRKKLIFIYLLKITLRNKFSPIFTKIWDYFQFILPQEENFTQNSTQKDPIPYFIIPFPRNADWWEKITLP